MVIQEYDLGYLSDGRTRGAFCRVVYRAELERV